MSLPISSLVQRRYHARAFSNGETFDYASIDAQNADLVEGHNQCKARLDAISTSAGSLKYALVSLAATTATALQTAFTVTAYDNTAGASFVLAWSGSSLIAQASITQTSTTIVTLPAQALNTVVTIGIFAAGNGTSQLASTSVGQGAALIGINDAGSYLTATTVEGGLQEIAANLASASYLGGVLTITGYLLKSGGTMTGAIAMGASKITGLAAGTAATNDAARMNDLTLAALTTTLGAPNALLTNSFLALTGGTMAGNIAMGSNKLTGLAAGTATGHSVRYDELIAQAAGNITTGTMAVARLPLFVGDNGSVLGTAGIVPAAAIGDQAAGKYLNAGGTWSAPNSTIGSGFFLLADQKATGVAGQSFFGLSGTWVQRDLQTTVVSSSYVAVAANAFTLAAGNYRLSIRAMCYKTNRAKLRLYNVTAAAVQAYGDAGYVENTISGGWVTLDCRITPAVSTNYRIDHYIANGVASGGGVEISDGSVEQYLTVIGMRE